MLFTDLLGKGHAFVFSLDHLDIKKNKSLMTPWGLFTLCTSKCSREQEMSSVFSDNVVSDGTETWPPAQLPNGLQELRVQRQRKAMVLLSLQGQAVHLPAAELPAMHAT